MYSRVEGLLSSVAGHHAPSLKKKSCILLQIANSLHFDLRGHFLALIDKDTVASSVGGDDH